MKQRYSLPTVNWVRFSGGDEDVAEGEYPTVCTLPVAVEAAAAVGFDAIGLYDYTLDAHAREGGSLSDVPALLGRHGLGCTDVGTLRVGEPGVEDAAEALAELASLTGAARCIAVFVSPVTASLVDELARCADVLAAAGIRVALEAVPYAGLSTLADAVTVCERVGWDRCGLLVDSWHFFTGGEPWDVLDALSGEQIALVHVSDGRVTSEDPVFQSRFRRLLPGAGSFPLARFRDAIERAGYEGPIVPEILSTDLRRLPPSEAARRTIESLRTAWPVGG